jgi:zeaxanthin glucosyltransferase
MKVLINMIPEPGHINPTVPLARALAARGHEVVYSSFLDLKPRIEAHGFRCLPIHCDIVPRGLLPFLDELVTNEERDYVWGTIRDRVHEEYFDVAPVSECLAAERPDIVLTDVVPVSPMQFAAHRLGLPCLQLCTSLPQWYDAALPPLTSALLPGAPPLELQAAQLQASCLQPLSNFPQLPGMFTWLLGAYCARHGYPQEDISFRSVFWPELTRLPEAVLAASVLDYPRSGPRRPNYIATAPSLDREEFVAPELQRFVARGGPLIYASFGSQPSRYAHSARFFQALIELCRARPQWRVVVTTGARYLKSKIFARIPDNLFALETAPQLWLLRHCQAFVTHAGLGGIREALALNVPMVAVPQQYDQPGNAARIEYHGIGRRIPADLLTQAGLAAALEEVLDDGAAYRERLAALESRCREEEQAGAGVALVEQIAASMPRRGSPAGESTRSAGATRGAAPAVAANDPTLQAMREGYLFVGDEAGHMFFSAGAEPSPLDPVSAPALGVAGFHVSPDLSHALSAACGPMLCRVALAGETSIKRGYGLARGLRSRWLLDVSEALYEYAAWCVQQISDGMRKRSPVVARGMVEVVERFHELRGQGASLDMLVRHYVSVQAATASYWQQGFGAALMAIDLMPNKAAQLARMHALIYLNGGVTDDAAYAALKARLDDELVRIVRRHLRAASIVEPALEPAALTPREQPFDDSRQRERAL